MTSVICFLRFVLSENTVVLKLCAQHIQMFTVTFETLLESTKNDAGRNRRTG